MPRNSYGSNRLWMIPAAPVFHSKPLIGGRTGPFCGDPHSSYLRGDQSSGFARADAAAEVAGPARGLGKAALYGCDNSGSSLDLPEVLKHHRG